MLKLPLIALAAAALTVSVANAQTTSTTTSTTTITPQQETAIKTYVTKEKTKSVTAPSGFTVSVGSAVPQDVELHTFNSDVGVTNYRYTVVNNRTVVVDPSSRKVVKIIE